MAVCTAARNAFGFSAPSVISRIIDEVQHSRRLVMLLHWTQCEEVVSRIGHKRPGHEACENQADEIAGICRRAGPNTRRSC